MSFIDKTKELLRYFPKPFYNLQKDIGLKGIITAIGTELNDLMTQTKNARDQYILSTSGGEYLEIHGVNRNVFQPVDFKLTDDQYKDLIRTLTHSPKNIEDCFEKLLRIFFGEDSLSLGDVDVFSVQRNLIEVPIRPEALIRASRRDLIGATYIHNTSTLPYDPSQDAGRWSRVLAQSYLAGSNLIILADLTDIPERGFVAFGGEGDLDYEFKPFVRGVSGLELNGITGFDHAVGITISGEINPDNYPSGYLFDPAKTTNIVGATASGSSIVVVDVLDASFPDFGVVFLGEPGEATTEVKGYSLDRINLELLISGTTKKDHSSGAIVVSPNMVTPSVRTRTTESITAGQTKTKIDVVAGADFPVEGSLEYVAVLNWTFNNEEYIPLKGRAIGNNQELLIDDEYVFQFDHATNSTIHLMAFERDPAIDGSDYAVFLNDTDSARVTFFSNLSRSKVVGVKIIFEVLEDV